MGDCSLSHFRSPKNEEKYCKYSYSSWCSTCEKNSPRRRSRSETNEPCRRRCKEMKTFSKKYNRSQEYENMEYEFETRNHWQEKDMRYECCRVRSNLCELPTSYISNNCQISILTNLPKMSNETSDFVDCLKSATPYNRTLKFVDFDNKLENLGSMQEKSKVDTYNVISPNKLDYMKNGKKTELKGPLTNGYMPVKAYVRHFQEPLSVSHSDLLKDNHIDYRNANVRSNETSKSCRECCTLIDLKLHDLSDRKPLCYDTGTYFDRRNDSINLHERYSKEVEYLRKKLRMLKNKNCSVSNKSPLIVEKLSGDTTREMVSDEVVSSPTDIKSKTKKDRKVVSPPLVKNVRSRVALKTRTKSANLKKIKHKPPNSVASSSDFNER